MRIRLAIPEGELREDERKEALDAALEAVTKTITPMVARGRVPPAAAAIRSGKVKWKPEPPGEENFDIPQVVLGRGWGDCDDLAPWHAASLRASGKDLRARAVVKKSGPSRWHAVVRRGDGSIDDPSRAAGMGSRVSGDDDVNPMAPIWRPMGERLALAMYPMGVPTVEGIVPITIARVDAPDQELPWSWSTTHVSGEPVDALCGAIGIMRALGEEGCELDGDDVERLAVIEDLVRGASPDEIADAIEEVGGDQMNLVDGMEAARFLGDQVGFSFGGLLKGIGKGLKTVASVAAPIAKVALPMAGTMFGPLGTAAGGLLASGLSAAAGGGPRRVAVPTIATAAQHFLPQTMPPMGQRPMMPFGGGGIPPFSPQLMQQLMQMLRMMGAGGGMPMQHAGGMPMQRFAGGPQLFRF